MCYPLIEIIPFLSELQIRSQFIGLNNIGVSDRSPSQQFHCSLSEGKKIWSLLAPVYLEGMGGMIPNRSGEYHVIIPELSS